MQSILRRVRVLKPKRKPREIPAFTDEESHDDSQIDDNSSIVEDEEGSSEEDGYADQHDEQHITGKDKNGKSPHALAHNGDVFPCKIVDQDLKQGIVLVEWLGKCNCSHGCVACQKWVLSTKVIKFKPVAQPVAQHVAQPVVKPRRARVQAEATPRALRAERGRGEGRRVEGRRAERGRG